MGCDTCKKEQPAIVPYIVYEAAEQRHERRDRRNAIIIAILAALVVISNGIWLLAWTSYDYSGEESTVDITASDGVANYIGGAGAIRNGGE